MSDIYSEIILDHYKHPHNRGHIKHDTHKAEEDNPLCGDNIKIYIKVSDKKIIEDISFEGEGCAISQASASMLTEFLKGKPVAQAKKITPEQIYNLLKIEISPARSKCALLALKTIKAALS
ncbi:MAG: SUF system NifU family Fe-S cluster assembly protein [Candidatus Peregrinibacteria bacterium]|nr:SUF system NifU family Fe-S cluster assembly protein [Candidatus Peregrinibacteria bacterium]